MSAHASLVQACVTYLQLHSIRAYAVNQVPRQLKDGSWHSLGAPSGLPDIIACAGPNGNFIGIECKTGKSQPRPDQLKVMKELEDAGATVLVVRSVDELEGLVR